jgi:type VI secretion system secreted protein VgrG
MRRYVLYALLLSLLIPSARADLLGSASSFAVLGGSTVTNTGPSLVYGNLGVSPGTAVTGFPPGTVIAPGSIYTDTPGVAGTAQNDLTTAYNTLAGLAVTGTLTGVDLGGQTLLSGVYFFATSAQLTGTLTLDAQGSNNALWVFQIGKTLTTATSSVVQVINGGPNDGLFWQVGSSATLGISTTFLGNILASKSITLNTSAIIPCGRALAEDGSVTLDSNVISTACTAIPEWSESQARELGGPGTGLSNPANNSAGAYAPSPVPEPGALLLFATCVASLAMRKWARSKPQNHGA